MNRFEDGTTLITWSTAGRQEAVSASGETLWQRDLDLGGVFGYTTRIGSIDRFQR